MHGFGRRFLGVGVYICLMKKIRFWGLGIALSLTVTQMGCRGVFFQADKIKKESMLEQQNNKGVFKKILSQLEHQQKSTDSIQKEEAGLFLSHLELNYKNYAPKSELILELKAILRDYPQLKIEIYGGNWCSDTHEGIPALLRVLEEVGFDANNLYYHWVSRDKKVVDGVLSALTIGSVPWVRIFDGPILKGEIVEFPKRSWELDMVEMLRVRP
jgi:hypothetical protein